MKTTVYDGNPDLAHLARETRDIEYARPFGKPLTLTLLRPWHENARYPLIVFVQGSAWTTPDVGYELPQLADYARAGFTVATIVHRSRLDGYPAPAFLMDAKSAVRFLRANADKFSVDPTRVCVFGTSSGGNTALLMGLTGDDPAYRSDVCPGESDAVQAVVDCFGPSDLSDLLKTPERLDEFLPGLSAMQGPKRLEALNEISPIRRVAEARCVPPMLLLSGDQDVVVLCEQTDRMAEALEQAGYEAELVHVLGAGHEHSFWSDAVHRHILDWMRRHMEV